MPLITANQLQLHYESLGADDAPAILLVMGLGAQLTRWNRELCDALVARGYRVIRFDNRDCGCSTRFDAAGVPDIGGALRAGKALTLAYTLDDMAADCIGLLDALAIARAHIVGASMGGAIAQIVAARYPERVLSLTSIMSSSGSHSLPPPEPAAALALFAPLPKERDCESIVADSMVRYFAVASPAYPSDKAWLRQMFVTEYERGFHPQGVARQLAAVIANGDRSALLATIKVPTLVLHGADDPLIPAACGRDVAEKINGAELRLINGMGHDFPLVLTDIFADAIEAAARRA